METPLIREDFLEYLNSQFPDVALDQNQIEDSERTIWFRAGQVSVVRHLRRVFEDQQENILA